jgi:hypothetical protein
VCTCWAPFLLNLVLPTLRLVDAALLTPPPILAPLPLSPLSRFHPRRMSTRYRLPLRAQHPWAPGPDLWRSATTVSSPIPDDCGSKKRVGAAPVESDSESELLLNKLESIYTYSQARGPQSLVQSIPLSLVSPSSHYVSTHPSCLFRTHQHQLPRNPIS